MKLTQRGKRGNTKLYSVSVRTAPGIGNYSANLLRPEWPLLSTALTSCSREVAEDRASLLLSASKSDR